MHCNKHKGSPRSLVATAALGSLTSVKGSNAAAHVHRGVSWGLLLRSQVMARGRSSRHHR